MQLYSEIRENFPFLNSRIIGLELTCRGSIKPTDQSLPYRIEIRYSAWRSPDVRVITPKIDFGAAPHMYKDGTLCLFDSREQPWQRNWHLHETIIPWTSEWLMFYEIWLLTGKWVPSLRNTLKLRHRIQSSDRFSPARNGALRGFWRGADNALFSSCRHLPRSSATRENRASPELLTSIRARPGSAKDHTCTAGSTFWTFRDRIFKRSFGRRVITTQCAALERFHHLRELRSIDQFEWFTFREVERLLSV